MAIEVIPLSPEVLWTLGPIPITNAMLAAFAASAAVIFLAILVRVGMGVVPSRLQVLMESLIDFYMTQLIQASGSEKAARRLLPLFFSLFLFLIFANQFGLIPFLGSLILGEEGTHLFRTPTTHYSLTIASALLVLGFTQILAFMIAPIQHIGNYIKIAPFFKVKSFGDFMMACIDFVLGLLDIVGELAKVVSLSTRLFGNIFAGEVIIAIVSSLLFATQFLVPLPFLVLSTASSFVQAFVLPFLAILFMGNTLSSLPKAQEKAI